MIVTGFDENDRKYRCCCNCIHAKVAAVIIGVLEGVLLTYKIVVSVGEFLVIGWVWPLVVTIGIAVLVFAAIVLMISGLTKVNHYFLLPHLTVQIISLILMLLLIIVAIFVIHLRDDIYSRILKAEVEKVPEYQTAEQANSNASSQSVFITTIAIGVIIVCALGSIVEAWFLTIVIKAYRYVRDKREALRQAHHGPPGSDIPFIDKAEKA